MYIHKSFRGRTTWTPSLPGGIYPLYPPPGYDPLQSWCWIRPCVLEGEVRQKTSCWLVSGREPAAGESTLLCNAYNCWLISLQQPWVMHTISLVWLCVRCCSLLNFPYCSNSLNRSNQLSKYRNQACFTL